MTSYDRYSHPLSERYASREMQHIFSPKRRFGTWRRLWLALAESEAELGINISDAALEQMRAALDSLDLERAADYERRFRHDVMAHVHALADVAPQAGPIIHLGATSQFVNCNTELLLLREAMEFYETAGELRPQGNDDAILRWNTCARVIMADDGVRPDDRISAPIQNE